MATRLLAGSEGTRYTTTHQCRGVTSGGGECLGRHHRRRRLAMGSGDRDELAATGHLTKCFRAPHNAVVIGKRRGANIRTARPRHSISVGPWIGN